MRGRRDALLFAVEPVLEKYRIYLRFVAVVLGKRVDVCVRSLLEGKTAVFKGSDDLTAGFRGNEYIV